MGWNSLLNEVWFEEGEYWLDFAESGGRNMKKASMERHGEFEESLEHELCNWCHHFGPFGVTVYIGTASSRFLHVSSCVAPFSLSSITLAGL